MKRPSTLVIALGGSLLMWAAQPPLALAWLGWIAPVPWLILVRQQELTGSRPYGKLWLAGFAFWLAAIHWIRLPHPAVYLGWLSLSAYLAIYLPLFVGLSRVAVHRLNVPLWLAAPIVWTGLELARAHVMTGFMMGSLAHSQAKWPLMIQIADLFGEYGVDFVMVLVAAAVVDFGLRIADCGLKGRGPGYLLVPLLPAAILLAAALAYGDTQLRSSNPQSEIRNPQSKTVRIALIQGNSLADWKRDPEKQQQIMSEYFELSKQAVGKATMNGNRPIDLLVWPETTFRAPLIDFDSRIGPEATARLRSDRFAKAGPENLAQLVQTLGVPVLVGIDRVNYLNEPARDSLPEMEVYNSSALVDREGKIRGTYDKFHLVMFGEYVPFSKYFPFLKRLSSLTGAAEAGAGPVALELDGVYYAPSICYETVIPHVIRRQVATLDAAGERPDVLVNLTNDAWYWGSSELDMHIACDVFRAIETRTPLVIAANGGISAWIDRHGYIRAQSPRQTPDVIIADVELNRGGQLPLYMRIGDAFAAVCLTLCVILAIIGWRTRRNPSTQY
ncbi:MAG: apolipoprotein N-acyltransferase [Pirellulales bacterium]